MMALLGVAGACNLNQLMQREDFGSLVSWNGTVLSIKGCDLEAIDVQKARSCIARIAPRGQSMVGDSLTRYQYLNLVDFLVHGEWNNYGDLPNENEKKFSGWNQFYEITNSRMGGHEICDCFRYRIKQLRIGILMMGRYVYRIISCLITTTPF